MNEEISHITQFGELHTLATALRLRISVDADCFYLWSDWPAPAIGRYLTLADLRAGLSDFIAGERAAKRLVGGEDGTPFYRIPTEDGRW